MEHPSVLEDSRGAAPKDRARTRRTRRALALHMPSGKDILEPSRMKQLEQLTSNARKQGLFDACKRPEEKQGLDRMLPSRKKSSHSGGWSIFRRPPNDHGQLSHVLVVFPNGHHVKGVQGK